MRIASPKSVHAVSHHAKCEPLTPRPIRGRLSHIDCYSMSHGQLAGNSSSCA